ncbi:MAG TPA: glutamate--cysteine ligase, partial [Candidatus Lokiarchaeia archaeon]|nr:glutamate--cysteine ligase [Candidatus Lokiarchaeia archaeon]
MSTTIEIQEQLSSQHVQVEGWFQEKYEDLRDQGVLPPIYASFDVRDSGFKATVVDSNAFPAGFNNLNEDSRTIAAQQFSEFLPQITEGTEILLILEDFSRNTFYFSNIRVLKDILAYAGYHAILGILAGNSGAGTKR